MVIFTGLQLMIFKNKILQGQYREAKNALNERGWVAITIRPDNLNGLFEVDIKSSAILIYK